MGFKALMAALLGLVVTAHPGFNSAQAAEKVYRIGYLAPSAIYKPFRQALHDLGYVEGRNLKFEFRQARTNVQYKGLAEELVRLNVDLIVAVGVRAVQEAKMATRTIPIVMANASADPVKQGLIESLARPGGNVTGVFDLLPDLAGKRVALLKEVFPKLSRIAQIAPNPPGGTAVGPAHLRATLEAARKLGIEVQDINVRRPEDLEDVFRTMAGSGVEAAVLVGVSFFVSHRNRIVQLAAKYRLPVIYTHLRWVPAGGLMAYTTDGDERLRRAAKHVDMILNGKNPAEIPAEQPTRYVLEVNLKTARALGIAVPPSILFRANRIIE